MHIYIYAYIHMHTLYIHTYSSEMFVLARNTPCMIGVCVYVCVCVCVHVHTHTHICSSVILLLAQNISAQVQFCVFTSEHITAECAHVLLLCISLTFVTSPSCVSLHVSLQACWHAGMLACWHAGMLACSRQPRDLSTNLYTLNATCCT